MPRASEPVRNVYVGPDSNSTGVGKSSCFRVARLADVNAVLTRTTWLRKTRYDFSYPSLRRGTMLCLFQHWSRPNSQQLRRTRHRKAVAVSASRGGTLMRTFPTRSRNQSRCCPLAVLDTASNGYAAEVRAGASRIKGSCHAFSVQARKRRRLDIRKRDPTRNRLHTTSPPGVYAPPHTPWLS
jgi:hypothetical protein